MDKERMTRVVGVTGGAGSGKSTFASELGRLGARVIDADRVGRELVEEREEIRGRIRDAFGDALFDEKGRLRRRALGRLVFSDPDALNRLNRIVQPFLIEEIENRISRLREAGVRLVVVDMAILFEAGFDSAFDEIVVITAPVEKRIDRLRSLREWSRKEALERIRSQWEDGKKAALADRVIPNDGSLEKLRRAAKDFFHRTLDA